MITTGARCTREIKYRIVMVTATFNKKYLYTSKLDLNFRKKLVKVCIGVQLCGAGSGTLRKDDQKYLGSFEM